MFSLDQKLPLENFHRHLLVLFCRELTENFQKIIVIIFWNFTMFYKRPDKPQVKKNVISSRENLVYELSHDLPNHLRLRILRNEEILGKS